METCPQCGNSVDPGGRFCAVCGRDLLGPAAPPAATPIQPPPPQTTPTTIYGMQPQTSGKAMASLVLGIFFFALPAAILAIIFGHLSLSDIKRSAGRLQGRGLAITGLVLGYMGIAAIPIILIIAAIAIPSLLRARTAANETSAVPAVRAINQAESRYNSTYGGFACTLSDLGGASESCSPSANRACLIDDTLASGRKYGYVFELQNCVIGPGGANTYNVVAYPQKYNVSGVRAFCSDQTGVLRFNPAGSAKDCLVSGEALD